MASIDKHMSIDKPESKTCIENRVVSTSMQEQVDIQQMVSSRDYSWYDKIRAGDRWNTIQVERQDINRYSIIIIKPEIRSKT